MKGQHGEGGKMVGDDGANGDRGSSAKSGRLRCQGVVFMMGNIRTVS